MRIIHMADVHLGVTIKAHSEIGMAVNVSTRNAFKRAIDKALSLNPDVLIISGDLFEREFGNVSSADIYTAMESLSKAWDKGVPVVGIEGNHDKLKPINLPDIKDVESPLRLLERSNLIIRTEYLASNVVNLNAMRRSIEAFKRNVKKTYGDIDLDIVLKEIPGAIGIVEKYVIIGDVAFVGVQYKPVNNRISDSYKFYEFLRLFSRIDYGTKRKVFMAHQTIEGIVSTEFIRYLNEQAIEIRYLPKGFDYYALGHIHQYTAGTYEGAYVVYPGSITFRDAGEFDYTLTNDGELIKNKCWDKGFVLYDMENNAIRRIRLKSMSSIRIKIALNSNDDPYARVRVTTKKALAMLRRAEEEFSDDSESIVESTPGVLVEIRSPGDRIIDDILLRDIIREEGAHPSVKIEYSGSGSVQVDDSLRESMDMNEILRSVFGDKYTYYLDVIESIGLKSEARIDDDADAFIRALRAALDIITENSEEAEKTFRILAKYLFKYAPIPLDDREKKSEEETKKEKIEEKVKGPTRKPRTLMDYFVK
ncbi:MAG TPA: hypothetical protein ENF25_02505 [Thermoprotei archaeon]|nr:hypothetical protein [Thermoprotei archaeon]